MTEFFFKEKFFLAEGRLQVTLPDVLTTREKEVLTLISHGLQNQEIADKLGLSIGTVKVHLKHILEKLKLKHRSQVIARFARALAS